MGRMQEAMIPMHANLDVLAMATGPYSINAVCEASCQAPTTLSPCQVQKGVQPQLLFFPWGNNDISGGSVTTLPCGAHLLGT